MQDKIYLNAKQVTALHISVEVLHGTKYLGTFLTDRSVWDDQALLKNIVGALLEMNQKGITDMVLQPKKGGGDGV